MGSATHRVTTSHRYEFEMSAPVNAVEMSKALHWAGQKFKEVKGREVEYDDDLWIDGDEESITVYFTATEGET